MNPCSEAKPNIQSYSWGGASRAGIPLSASERALIRVTYDGEDCLKTREALTTVLSFFSLAKWKLLSAHEALPHAGFSKGKEAVWLPNTISGNKGVYRGWGQLRVSSCVGCVCCIRQFFMSRRRRMMEMTPVPPSSTPDPQFLLLLFLKLQHPHQDIQGTNANHPQSP